MIFNLILILFITKSESSLKLVFSDEFNENDSIDQNKWDVTHEEKECNGNYINQLNCKTNNKTNIRIIDGTLALAAIQHKYLNKEYTAPLITTKESFTYGRFEMRAALPKGKMLRPAIFLIPITNTGDWPKDGQIDVFINTQKPQLIYGIHYLDKSSSYQGHESNVEESLNDFNTYTLEWFESGFSWTFNGELLHTINTNNLVLNESNLFNKPFKLSINLGIGGSNGFEGETLHEGDAKEWNCSLLIFDYIRIYQNVTEQINSPNNQDIKLIEAKLSSNDICNKIMPTIQSRSLNKLNKCSPWKLTFSDEFNKGHGQNGNNIDYEKWFVEHEVSDCDGNYNNQLHCKTNSKKNIRLIDGTLVLAAIREKYLKKDFTAPMISTKTSFKYGRFEIRAALADGKMLRTFMYMDPKEEHNPHLKIWAKDGQIDILANSLLSAFYCGIHYSVGEDEKIIGHYTDKSVRITDSLSQFHTYVMEWTETEISWEFDNKPVFRVNYKDYIGNNYNPFDKPFKLVISLGVGGDLFFPDQTLTMEEADDWNCSLLIVDYVRVYEYEGKTRSPEENTNTTSSEICAKVMPTIRKPGTKPMPTIVTKISEKEESSTFNLIAIISISSFLLLLALIPFMIFLFIRVKNYRQSTGDRGREDPKDQFDFETYDNVGDTEYPNSYVNPYEMINENLYQNTERSGGEYLVMTNKYVEKPN